MKVSTENCSEEEKLWNKSVWKTSKSMDDTYEEIDNYSL